MQLFDSLGRGSRAPDLLRSLAELAEEDDAARGAVFTRPDVVESILDLAEYVPSRPLHRMRLLEPSFGGGDFLLPALDRLLCAFEADGGGPERAAELEGALLGVEIHPTSFEDTRARVVARLIRWGCAAELSARLALGWLVSDDFLLAPVTREFDVVVGNPPYVRQERIPGPLLAEYRRRYTTLFDRADLYVPFIERGLRLLAPEGRLAFICSNRWVKNKYGGPLRALIAKSYHLTHYIDMEGTASFQADVIAYPSISVIARKRGTITRVGRADGSFDEIAHAVVGDEPWLLDEPDQLRLLRRLEERYPELEASGCQVGIGVATGLDKVFIGDLGALPVEAERRLPLVMAGDLQNGEIVWGGKGVVNPFEADGRLAEFSDYPRFGAYLEKHREAIAHRHCAQKNPSGWYRTIDRIWSDLTGTPKLLIPDIKGEAAVVYDEGRFYPHHNLYWIASKTWDLRALATLLRSSVALLFVSTYCIKMAGGFLRFQAQYLRRIRVPRWESLPEAQRARLVAAAPGDRKEIDAATAEVYGLSPEESALVRRVGEATRVKKKAP